MNTRRRFLAATAATTVLSALGGQAKAQAAKKKLKLLVGTAPPDPGCHFFYYARENGFYAQEGLDVEFLEFPAETTAVRALVAGDGDIAWAGPVSQLTAIKSGARLRVISAFAPKLDYSIVANKNIAAVKDLEGHSISVAQPGAISQIVPQLMLEQAHGDTSKVVWVSLGNSAARLQALIAKRVDAAALNSGFAARAITYDYLHIIGDAAKDLPNFLYGFEGAFEQTIQRKHDEVQAFVTATMRAVRWSIKNPKEAALVSEKILPDTPKSQLEATAQAYSDKHFFNETGILAPAAWKFTNDWMVRNGNLTQPFKYSDIVDLEFVNEANKRLGPPT